MSDLHATFVRFPSHVGQSIVCHNVAVNLSSICRDEFLVALARMEEQLCAILFLSPVETCQRASIRNHDWHLHLQQSNNVAIVIGQLNASEFLIDSSGDNRRICIPCLPLFLGKTITLPFDNGCRDSVLLLSLLGSVFLVWFIKQNFC